MFRPHISICLGCEQEKMMVVKKMLCKKCNYESKHGNGNKPVRKPIKKYSDRRRKQEIAYQALRKVYLATHSECEAKISKECMGQADQIHHMVGRIGELLNDDTKFLAVCSLCHQWIENNRLAAIEKGFSELRTNK